MKFYHKLAWVLVIAGAIHLGLVGFINLNLVEGLFGGPESMLTRLFYAAVGLAGVWLLWTRKDRLNRLISD